MRIDLDFIFYLSLLADAFYEFFKIVVKCERKDLIELFQLIGSLTDLKI